MSGNEFGTQSQKPAFLRQHGSSIIFHVQILALFLGGFWFAADLNSRVQANEKQLANLHGVPRQISALQAKQTVQFQALIRELDAINRTLRTIRPNPEE